MTIETFAPPAVLRPLGITAAAPVELTIASGAVTATQLLHTVDTESDAAADELDTISGGTDGQLLLLWLADAGRVVTLKHGSGNIVAPGGSDRALSRSGFSMLVYDGGQSKWILSPPCSPSPVPLP